MVVFRAYCVKLSWCDDEITTCRRKPPHLSRHVPVRPKQVMNQNTGLTDYNSFLKRLTNLAQSLIHGPVCLSIHYCLQHNTVWVVRIKPEFLFYVL